MPCWTPTHHKCQKSRVKHRRHVCQNNNFQRQPRQCMQFRDYQVRQFEALGKLKVFKHPIAYQVPASATLRSNNISSNSSHINWTTIGIGRAVAVLEGASPQLYPCLECSKINDRNQQWKLTRNITKISSNSSGSYSSSNPRYAASTTAASTIAARMWSSSSTKLMINSICHRQCEVWLTKLLSWAESTDCETKLSSLKKRSESCRGTCNRSRRGTGRMRVQDLTYREWIFDNRTNSSRPMGCKERWNCRSSAILAPIRTLRLRQARVSSLRSRSMSSKTTLISMAFTTRWSTNQLAST